MFARSTDPYRLWRWRAVWPVVVAASATAAAFVVFALALPVYAVVASGGVTRTLALQLLEYVFGLPSLLSYRLAQYGAWQTTAPASFGLAASVALLAGLAAGLHLASINPFPRVPPIFGNARFARRSDITRMERRGIASVRHGRHLHLGLVHGRTLRAMETLSVLVVAPPGSGKTAGFVVPTILDAGRRTSLVVHDLKPEIADLTSAHRARLGPVWILDWAARDDNEAGIYYPRWNPLSPRAMPPRGAQRDLYIDRLAKILVPEEGQQDPFWPRKAQALLTGCVQYLVARINDRTDPGRWAGLPPAWHGGEASLPMLLDWLTEGQLAARERGGGDPMASFFTAAVAEAKRHAYPYRAVQELADALSTVDRTRDGVLTTLTGALAVFRNEAVRARTSASDFAFADLRGVRTASGTGAQGRWQPVTIYLRTRQADARALAVINALFIEALAAFLVGSDPGSAQPDNTVLGPLDVCFALDELPQLPRLDAALTGPAVGRSKGVFFLLIAQDLKQIESKYGAAETSALQTSCAFTVVFNQNNFETAKALSDRVGSYTYVKTSTSERAHDAGATGAQLLRRDSQRSRSFEAALLLKPQDLMSIPHGQHYVLVQGFHDRPIRARTPWWFRDARLRARARGRPAPPMPEAAADALRARTASAVHRVARAERLYVATPADLEAFGAPAGWGGVVAHAQADRWVVRAMAGGALDRIDALRAEARLVLFDRYALRVLATALDTPIAEADCDFVADHCPAPSLYEAASLLLPPAPAQLEPDLVALLLMALFDAATVAAQTGPRASTSSPAAPWRI
jgi:type IV secretory pathway TraG/TraD family ATPase VirD4